MLRNIFIVYKYELARILKRSSIGIIIAIFLGLGNLIFLISLESTRDFSIAETYTSFLLLITIFIPVLSSYIFLSENRYHVYPLLESSPISNLELILGKFFAVVSIYKTMILITVVYAIFFHFTTTLGIDWGMAFTSILGNLLLGILFISIGTFFACVTSNNVLQVFSTYGACLGLIFIYTIGNILSYAYPNLSKMLMEISFIDHYFMFAKGILSLGDLAYFILFTISMLLLSIRSMEIKNLNR